MFTELLVLDPKNGTLMLSRILRRPPGMSGNFYFTVLLVSVIVSL